MKPASEAQLRRLAAHGRLEDKDYTMKEASDLIGAILEANEEPIWNLADQNQSLIRNIETRQIKKAIRNLEKQIAIESLMQKERCNLSDELDSYQDRLVQIGESKNETKESLREEKEMQKERILEFQEELGPDGMWSDFIKKPNQSQIKQSLEALDREYPNWERDKGLEALIATLTSNFPELQKRDSQPVNKSKGCLSLLVISFAIITFVSIKIYS